MENVIDKESRNLTHAEIIDILDAAGFKHLPRRSGGENVGAPVPIDRIRRMQYRHDAYIVDLFGVFGAPQITVVTKPITQICYMCHRVLDFDDEFYGDNSSVRKHGRCRECTSAYKKEKRAKEKTNGTTNGEADVEVKPNVSVSVNQDTRETFIRIPGVLAEPEKMQQVFNRVIQEIEENGEA